MLFIVCSYDKSLVKASVTKLFFKTANKSSIDQLFAVKQLMYSVNLCSNSSFVVIWLVK